MKVLKDQRLFSIVPLFLFLFSSESSHTSGPSLEMVGKIINFIVLFGGLCFLLRKTILKYFEERIALTKKELDRASQEKEEGQRRREEIVRRYQRLDEELAKIRKDSLRQAEERKKEIILLAQKEAQRLRDLTGKEVDWLYQKHLWSLKKYAAEMAVKLAREKIRKDLSTPTHHQLIQKSIDNLGKVYEKFSAR